MALTKWGSLIVVFNSARLVREGEEFEAFEQDDDDTAPDERPVIETGELAAESK